MTAHPVATPVNDRGQVVVSGDLSTQTFRWRPANASQIARVALFDSARTDWSGNYQTATTGSFDKLTIRVSGDAAGNTPIAGAKISSDRDGGIKVRACSEGIGHTCTVTSGNYPNASGVTTNVGFNFSVPQAHTGDVYLTAKVERANYFPRTYSLRYRAPLQAGFPLAARAPGGVVATGSVRGQAAYAEGGGAQQAAVFLRESAHGAQYDSNHANLLKSDFGSVTFKVTSDAAGANVISGARLSADEAGAIALATGCPVTSNSCTISSGNWPGTPRAGRLNVVFSVPTSHSGLAYLHITSEGSQRRSGTFALEYADTVDAHPLAMPGGTSDGTPVTSRSRTFAAAGATQQATINLRAAAHSGTYAASAANAAPAAIDSVTISIASDEAGANLISGAKISSDSAGNTALTGCTGTPNTCTITAANWPAASGATTALDFYFSVPSGQGGAAYLVVTASKTGEAARSFALEYNDAELNAVPLIVPAANATGTITSFYNNKNIANQFQQWLGDGLTTRTQLFLRAAAHNNVYVPTAANAAAAEFDHVTIRLAKDPSGDHEFTGLQLAVAETLGGATLCDEGASLGTTCTIQSANWPVSSGTTTSVHASVLVPISTTGPIYFVATVVKAGKASRTFSLHYRPRYVDVHPVIAAV